MHFKGVTPVIANDKNALRKLDLQTEKFDNVLLEDMTPVYETWNDDSEIGKAVKEGKEVAFLVTGEDYVKYCLGSGGYKTQASLTRHIDDEPIYYRG